jgi:drug/metabolite transporter (DMT)-like permease
MSSLFFAILFMPLADVTALTFLAPVFVAIMSPWLLSKHPGCVWLAAAACSAGVLLVTRSACLLGETCHKMVGLALGLLQPLAAATSRVLFLLHNRLQMQLLTIAL